MNTITLVLECLKSSVDRSATAMCVLEIMQQIIHFRATKVIFYFKIPSNIRVKMFSKTKLLPYIGNHSQKKTFANFLDFGMIANVFLLPLYIF